MLEELLLDKKTLEQGAQVALIFQHRQTFLRVKVGAADGARNGEDGSFLSDENNASPSAAHAETVPTVAKTDQRAGLDDIVTDGTSRVKLAIAAGASSLDLANAGGCRTTVWDPAIIGWFIVVHVCRRFQQLSPRPRSTGPATVQAFRSGLLSQRDGEAHCQNEVLGSCSRRVCFAQARLGAQTVG
jgi:hypothetical protein